MQKPVLNIFEDDDVLEALDQNLETAISLAILLHFHEYDAVPLHKIFETLCNFSYKGDIRMRYKMENPDKVKNIVKGSMNELEALYLPKLEEMD